MIEAACGIMYNSEHKILMGKRCSKNKNYPNLWEFPGGKREKNETIQECLKREWMEELNVNIEIEKKIHESVYDNKYHCYFFIGKIIDEENMEKRDHDEILFLHKDEIYKLDLFDGDDLVLDKL